MQVQRCFEYLKKAEPVDIPDVRYDVRVKRSGSDRSEHGVYMRNPSDTGAAVVFSVDIRPRLHEVHDLMRPTDYWTSEDMLAACNALPGPGQCVLRLT